MSRMRYLQKEEKDKILKELEILYELPPATKHNQPNTGLDEKIIPFIKKLNVVEGLATLQSCQGHGVGYKLEGKYHHQIEQGVIRFKFNEKKSKKFYEKVEFLSSIRGITDIIIIFRYMPYRRYCSYKSEIGFEEIIDIFFKGFKNLNDPKEYEKWEDTIKCIVRFFENL